MRYMQSIKRPISAALVLIYLYLSCNVPLVLSQPDPPSQCEAGIQRFNDAQYAEALPLLEAGFAGRDQASFANSDDLGRCAFALGKLRMEQQQSNALDAYLVALATFRLSGNMQLEAVTLDNLAQAYQAVGKIADAQATLEQLLVIQRARDDLAGQGDTLNNLGIMHYFQLQYAEALDALQQARELRQKVNNPIAEGQTVSNIGLIYQEQGKYPEALAAYEQAHQIFQHEGQREFDAGALINMGVAYDLMAKYKDALEVYDQALSIRRDLHDLQGQGQGLNNRGTVYKEQGRYTEALADFEQVIKIKRDQHDQTGEAKALNNTGAVYRELGRYTQALEMFQQALALHRAAGNRGNEGETLGNIGNVYAAQGRYGEALEILQQAQKIAHEIEDKASEGQILNNIGAVYQRQGRPDEALGSFNQALAVHQALGNPLNEAGTLSNLGTVYNDLGRQEDALKAYQQALKLQRDGGDRAGTGQTLTNIGGIDISQGKNREALTTLNEALSIARDLGDRVGEGGALTSMGVAYRDQGAYEQALTALEQALAVQRLVGDQTSIGLTLNDIGTVYVKQGRKADALGAFQQAIAALNTVRAGAGSEKGRAAFIAQYAGTYDRAVQLAQQQGQEDLAFQISEQGRARAFLDTLATTHIQLADNDAQTLMVTEQETYAAQRAAQVKLAQARAAQHSDPTLIAKLEQELRTADQTHTEAVTAIDQHGGWLSSLIPGRNTGVLDRAGVQQLLNPLTTLVAYYVLDDQTLAFVMTHDRLTVVALTPGLTELQNTISSLRRFANTNDPHPPAAARLYAWLIAPLRQQNLLTTPYLAIVPHRVLHYLPFAALSDGTHSLIDDYTVALLPSASSLPFIQSNADHALENPLILGNPDGTLGYAERESKAIAQLYGVSALLGTAATKQSIHARAQQAGIVHVAAHGSFDIDDPLASNIALAPDGDDDGRLHVSEVYGLKFTNASLIVLSACETQINELNQRNIVTAGDEVVGMTRALFFAGSPTVITTLWTVNDTASALLMERFYTHLQAGADKAEALRLAQQDVRATYPNPYYWAGFVLSGDPGQASGMFIFWQWLKVWQSRWVWLTSGSLILVMLLGVLVYRRRAVSRRNQALV